MKYCILLLVVVCVGCNSNTVTVFDCSQYDETYFSKGIPDTVTLPVSKPSEPNFILIADCHVGFVVIDSPKGEVFVYSPRQDKVFNLLNGGWGSVFEGEPTNGQGYEPSYKNHYYFNIWSPKGVKLIFKKAS